jgi:hypothetical protein
LDEWPIAILQRLTCVISCGRARLERRWNTGVDHWRSATAVEADR